MQKLGENQQKWVDALLSGKYKQGDGHLQFKDRYCCLGVACVVAEENGVEVFRDNCGELYGPTLTTQEKVKEWLGLYDAEGSYLEEDYSTNLTELNDGGVKFKSIAQTIKENADQLFSETK
jgi:hypothetical protein